jgi:uncharacterized RDD family membrane protein YckC
MNTHAAGFRDARAPGLRRRLACFVYEGMLLFGVVMIAGYLYSSLTQQRHALQGTLGLQVFLFLVLGIYFVWFWTHGGQTVAMKTWHIRAVDAHGRPLTQPRALCRYLLSWVWFVPALALIAALGLRGGGVIAAVLLSGVLIYALTALLHPSRQFSHDLLCGTRLIDSRPSTPTHL